MGETKAGPAQGSGKNTSSVIFPEGVWFLSREISSLLVIVALARNAA
jgi:hypothetical protein